MSECVSVCECVSDAAEMSRRPRVCVCVCTHAYAHVCVSGRLSRKGARPSPHPSLASTLWSLFPAVRMMDLHELIM